MFLRQSTIQTIRFGPFLDATDGVSEEVSLTITQALRRLSKDGGAFAQSGTSGNATHDEDGWYSVDLSAADTATLGELILAVQVPATHLPVWMRWWVVEEAVYDDFYVGAGYLKPTVAARTLDVTAAGEAGLDLDNTSGTLAAAQIASAAFTAAKFGADFITAASIADDSIGSDQLATDAIGNLQLATDCIGAAEFSNFAAGKVADSVWDEPKAGHTNTSNFGDLATDLDSVLADTADMQPKLGAPAADVSADIAAVKAETASIQAETTPILADTADMQPKLGSPATDVSADIAAVKVDTAAILVDTTALTITGTASSGSTTTLVDNTRTEGDADYWKGMVLLITNGTIAGQARRITAYDEGTDTFTVDTAFTQAVSTNTYAILQTTYNEAPAAGSGDWSAAEKEQFRSALGLDGTKTAAVGGQLQTIDGVVDTILVDTADMQPKLGTPATDVSADIAAVKVDTAAILVDTGTTIPGTITTLQADTDDIQTRLPASLVGGAMDSDVSAVQANAIDAAALATDAVDEIADGVWDEPKAGHVGATTFGDLAVDLDAVLLDTGTTIPGTITTLQSDTDDIQTRLPAALVGGAMDSDVSAIQAGAVDAAAIATDAVDADALAADAVAEIADGVWDEPKAGHIGATTFGDLAPAVAAVKVDTAAILVDTGTTIPATITTLQADTDDIQTRLPASLVGGAMDSDVSVIQAGAVDAAAIATDAIDADALAADAVTEIRDAILPVKNIAFNDIPVSMVDDTDHFTPKTGLSLTVTRSIDGGAFGAGTGTASELSNGNYSYDASAADMNGKVIDFRFQGTAADDTKVVMVTGG